MFILISVSRASQYWQREQLEQIIYGLPQSSTNKANT